MKACVELRWDGHDALGWHRRRKLGMDQIAFTKLMRLTKHY